MGWIIFIVVVVAFVLYKRHENKEASLAFLRQRENEKSDSIKDDEKDEDEKDEE